MIKIIFWGIVVFLAYAYFRPRLEAGKPPENILDDEEYVTIKIPKNKKEKPKSNGDDYTDFDEVV